jgi:hypothetical protein
MFTVRWKTIHSQDIVFQAARVIGSATFGDRATNGDGKPINGHDVIALEFYDAAHAQAHDPILFGSVYVMNESGKTVANYNLGGWHMRSSGGAE